MHKLSKEIKDIKRLRQILIVLFENGFGYIVDKIGLKKLIPLKNRLKPKLKKLKPEQRVRITLEQLGPTFIKFGQLLSLRPDILPLNYIKELSKLQDKVAPFSFDEVEKQIEKELKKPIKKIFSYFEKKPLASASISQVHKAKLNGKDVAVKIQRPNVQDIMQEDIHIMVHLAALLEKNDKIKKYRPLKIVREFADWTKKELDFKNEAKNAKRFKRNFIDNRSIVIPGVYDNYTTRKILTLDFIKGTELRNIKKTGHDLRTIFKNGFDAILIQVFEHGFFHADPHPGNILITENGKIAFVDFGIFGKFDKRLRRNCISLFTGIIENDADEIEKSILEMGSVKKDFDKLGFKEDIKKVIEPLQSASLKDIKISRILEETLSIALKYEIRLPIAFVLFGKTIATLEGIALQYDPNFKIVENSQPFIERLIKKEFSIKNMARESLKTWIKFKKFIKELPDQTTKALKTIQEGRVKIDIKDSDIKGLSVEIDKSSNRLAYGMVIAALIIAGALTVNVKMLTILNLPIISFICFVFAGILGLLLLKSILAEKKIGEVK